MDNHRDEQSSAPERVESVDGTLAETLALNRLIIETVPGGIVHVRADGSILQANQEALRFLGLGYDELTRRYTRDFEPETIWEDGSPCTVEDYPVTRAILTGERQPPRTIGVRRPDGALVWAVFTAVPVKRADGTVTGSVATFLDLTDRKAAESRLRASEERYRELVEQSPDPMLILLGGSIAFVNAAGVRLLGASEPAELEGRGFGEFLPDTHRAAFEPRLEQIADGLVVSGAEELLVRLDGSRVEIELAAVPVTFHGQRAIQLVARDITERRRAELQYRLFQTQLQHTQKLESLGVLAGGIAHDFNNLLTAILGNSGLAKMCPDEPAAVASYLDRIEIAAKRAADLTNQMLAYSGKGRFVVQAVDLSQQVGQMADLLGSVVVKKAHLDYHFAPDLPFIQADVAQLQQIVMNLITNASDALGERGGHVRVATRREWLSRAQLQQTYVDDGLSEGWYVVLEVADDGIGMDEDTRARIFDPFFTTKAAGRGLGLAATLGIVRGHGGAVEVDSRPHEGTTFRVFFPAADEARTHTPAAPVRSTTGLRATVLVVDDEPAVREVARLTLAAYGFGVLTADRGHDAIVRYAEHRAEIDLVLLDMTMPDLSGEEVLAELRRLEPGVRVVLTSGYAEQDVVGRVAGERVSGFVPKPFTPARLIDELRRALAAGGPG